MCSVWEAASPGNLLKIKILRPHPLPAESETPEVGPAICVLMNPVGASATCYMLYWENLGSYLCVPRWLFLQTSKGMILF